MGLNTRNKSVKNKTECRLLDYRVIFLKKPEKLRISAKPIIKNNRPITDYFENAKYRPIYRPYRLIGSSLINTAISIRVNYKTNLKWVLYSPT